MNLEVLLNTYDFSSKIGVFCGTRSAVIGIYDLWKLKAPPIPNQEKIISPLPLDNTMYNAIKLKTLPVIGKINKVATSLFLGLAFGFSIFTVAKHYDDPCVLAKMLICHTSAEMLKFHKTAEKICLLCPSIILQKISPQKEENNSVSKTIVRKNLEKNSVEVIHKLLKYTASITLIAYGLYSIYSHIQPLREAWDGMSPPERAHKRLGERHGNGILDFEKNSKEKILILYEQDTSQVIDGDTNIINAFKADHDLKVKVLATGESSYKEICDALQTGHLKAVFHTVHGSPYLIDTKDPTQDELNCISKYILKQTQKPTYILESCEAGHLATSLRGPAIRIANTIGMKVFANTEVTSFANIFDIHTNPVEVTFTEFFRPWIESTVTIEPTQSGYHVESLEKECFNIEGVKRTLDRYLISHLRT